jgi:hypothetical protein
MACRGVHFAVEPHTADKLGAAKDNEEVLSIVSDAAERICRTLLGTGPMSSAQSRAQLIGRARDLAARVALEDCPLAGACVVSSVAAGDFTPASDVDMLMVPATGEGRPEVYRKLVHGRVFEWMIISRDHLTDVDGVLADAGLAHDVLTAVILIDEGGWLEEVQSQVRRRHQQPRGVWTRAAGQLQRIRVAIDGMERQLGEGNILRTQRSHVSVLKGVLGLPRALLIRRCTMTRGVMFCREATTELGWPDYLAAALAVLGVSRVGARAVGELHETALEIIRASGFCDAEKAIRARHLHGSRWLLKHAGPADAAWPLYFWSSATVEEAGGEGNPASWEPWQRFAAVLGIDGEQQLVRKMELARQLLAAAVELVQAYRPKLGLEPTGS